MCLVQHVSKVVGEALIPVPLLTELVLAEAGFNYRHCAPNGAVPKPSSLIPPRTAKNPKHASGRKRALLLRA
jgi:hypothetical protein